MRALFLGCFFSAGLLFFRVVYTGERLFVFLLWNLFLAALPYAITWALQHQLRWIEEGKRFAVAFTAWLLLLPNSFYIVTDLFHLHLSGGVPLWFDLALLFSCAWNGCLMGMASLRAMERLIYLRFPVSNRWLFRMPVFALSALGIYIGRYQRFNSWDLFAQPSMLARECIGLFIQPVANRADWGMIIVFTLLLAQAYALLGRIVQGWEA